MQVLRTTQPIGFRVISYSVFWYGSDSWCRRSAELGSSRDTPFVQSLFRLSPSISGWEIALRAWLLVSRRCPMFQVLCFGAYLHEFQSVFIVSYFPNDFTLSPHGLVHAVCSERPDLKVLG